MNTPNFRSLRNDRGNTARALDTFANIAASQTDAALVAGVAGKKIVVLGLVMVTGDTATTVTFNSKPSASAGSAISMTFANAANGGAVLPYQPAAGYCMTKPGEGLSCTTGAGSTTGIQLQYALIDATW